MLQNDSALGVRNDHSSTVKKPGMKSQMNKGSQHRRPSSGQQPPQKVCHSELNVTNAGCLPVLDCHKRDVIVKI